MMQRGNPDQRIALMRDREQRAAALRHLIASDGWKLIEARLGDTIASEINQLKNDLDVVPTAKLRGGIQVLEMVRDLPSLMLAEVEQ